MTFLILPTSHLSYRANLTGTVQSPGGQTAGAREKWGIQWVAGIAPHRSPTPAAALSRVRGGAAETPGMTRQASVDLEDDSLVSPRCCYRGWPERE